MTDTTVYNKFTVNGEYHSEQSCLKSDADADVCADADTDWCSYICSIAYDPSFCNSADTDIDRSSLAMRPNISNCSMTFLCSNNRSFARK